MPSIEHNSLPIVTGSLHSSAFGDMVASGSVSESIVMICYHDFEQGISNRAN